MKGCIVQRSKGTWRLLFDAGRDPQTGRRRQRSVTVRGTKKDAERKLRELLHSLETGSYVKPARVTLGQYLRQWLKGQTNLRPSTLAGYTSKVERHLIPELGQLPLTELRPQHLQAFYQKTLETGRIQGGRLSSSTVNQCHRILGKALADAVRLELVSRNVALAATPPRPGRHEMRFMNQAETLRFLETARGTDYYPLFYTLLFSGLRRSEALGLRWRDLDLTLGHLSVAQAMHTLKGGEIAFCEPKTAKGRRLVSLPPSLAILLRQHRENHEAVRAALGTTLGDDDLVFAWPDGRPMLPDTVSHAWEKVAQKAGLEGVRMHDARHTHASLMLAQGVHPKIVSERLGHATIAITLDTYSHVTPGLQEAAARAFEEGLGLPGGTSRALPEGLRQGAPR
ncbi:MAG: site-specific integrase [Chloroflexi bacterium]|nr:site-specific integrase [Chloroflexota bacterium]